MTKFRQYFIWPDFVSVKNMFTGLYYPGYTPKTIYQFEGNDQVIYVKHHLLLLEVTFD